MLSTKKKILINSTTLFLYRLVTLAYGFIIPHLVISHYGSKINGWVTSISKFLSLISVCEFGIGSVIKSNLYEPLLKNETTKIRGIIKTGNRFFYRLGLIFLVYIILLMAAFTFLDTNPYNTIDTCFMIIIISLGTFSQYFFGMLSQLLLEADQKGYVDNIISAISLIVTTITSVIIVNLNLSIFSMRIAYAIIFSIRPIMLYLYARKKYKLDVLSDVNQIPIKQKWNGFTFHIAQFVQDNTDTMVLATFSSVINVSIYSVYHLVTNGLAVFVSIVSNTLTPVFGRIYASNSIDGLKKNFEKFEYIMHAIILLVFTTCSLGIVSFVSIYTRGVKDANYIEHKFGLLMTVAMALYCLTQVYLPLIYAAGRYKETQKYAIVEPVINLLLSVMLVKHFGIVGVAVGTIISMIYKLLFLTIYLQKHIIHKKFSSYINIFFMDLIIVISVRGFGQFIGTSNDNYINWTINMASIFLFGFTIVMLLLYKLVYVNKKH